jgi:hypothetical protein
VPFVARVNGCGPSGVAAAPSSAGSDATKMLFVVSFVRPAFSIISRGEVHTRFPSWPISSGSVATWRQ